MIAGIFHQGSGLGNQLHRYVATRALAADKGYEFGMVNPELFKGRPWMQIDLGLHPSFRKFSDEFQEKKVLENGVDIRSYDPEINFVADNTIIDGEFQDPRYFEHRMGDIARWLAVEPLSVPDDVCIIGFRGGEFALFPDLYLPHEYYLDGMNKMREKGITKFEVHTDDTEEARKFFSYLGIECIHDIAVNWRTMRYAKHAIIANSSFYILPRLLKHFEDPDVVTIAPRYWARRNTGVWALPSNYYKPFRYL